MNQASNKVQSQTKPSTSQVAAISHQPVMLSEVINGLDVKREGIYLDATFGRGGHSTELLARLNGMGRLIVTDRDPQAIAVAQKRFSDDDRVTIRQACFDELAEVLTALGISAVDGILMDIGVSSPQIDTPERGFSFMHDGPLDMRMNPDAGVPVSQWLQESEADAIAKVLWEYGEERQSRRIARAIVNRDKPLQRTGELADLVEQTIGQGSRKSGKHPATRTFQALRIFINDELQQLKQGLSQALNALNIGGRLAVISFHSLEDRIVKRCFQQLSRPAPGNRRLPAMTQSTPLFRLLDKHLPGSDETSENVRSRSAVLRIIERVAAGEVTV